MFSFLIHFNWRPCLVTRQHSVPNILHHYGFKSSVSSKSIRDNGRSGEARSERLAQVDKNKSHWLDRVFHGALRDYLENAMRQWWIHGLVTDRCRSYKELQGVEKKWLKEALERQFQMYQDKYADRVVDSRSRLHVSIASLVLASKACLKPFLKDDSLLEEIISEHMGSRTAPALELLMKLTSFFHRNDYETAVGRLQALHLDYGHGFGMVLKKGQEISTLTIHSCLYNEIFKQEGSENLSSCCCCSQDRIWLESNSFRSVFATLVSSQASGDALCRFVVRRQQHDI